MEKAKTLEENLSLMRGVSFALISLARASRTNQFLRPPEKSETRKALELAITGVLGESRGQRLENRDWGFEDRGDSFSSDF